ncbi:hypothetical protein B0H19DRAFT_321972 [Mycena capillaripes]|nr:hypothetical protein B0H19DRAFT_321972 [Mycena capillaripes]
MPPIPMVSSHMAFDQSIDSSKMPIRSAHQSFRASPMPHPRRPIDATDSDDAGHSRAGSSGLSSSGRHRTSQTARKSTGNVAPRRRSDGSIERLTSPRNSPLPIDPTHDPGPVTPCGLCSFPLQITPYSIIDPSQPIHDLLTICKHRFHWACYFRWLTAASFNSRACCPKCTATLLTNDLYWFHVTTNTGNQCYTDITKEVEERFTQVGLARQQIFFESLIARNLNIAAFLLEGPGAVDVNYHTPEGGRTPLHFCAMYNDVAGINFLLSHGADKHQMADDGLLPIDYAKSNNAPDAVERLA